MPSIPTFQDILLLCDSHQLVKAEAACCRVLKADPDNARALLLGGSIALDLGDKPTSQYRLRRLASLASAGPEMHYQAALLLARGNDLGAAVAVLREVTARHPESFPALYNLAQMEDELHLETALHTYEAAINANPGHAGPFTRRATLLLKQTLGSPLVTPSGKAQPVNGGEHGRLVMSTLGSNGRFGNQLLQYCLLRALGEVHEITVETPDWIGRWLFDLSDPYLGAPLPVLREEEGNLANLLLQKTGSKTIANHDIWGYGCYHTRFYQPHRDLMRRLFTPGGHIFQRTDAANAMSAAKGKTLVALHLRRGDFGHDPFWIAPEDWYLEWLQALWPQLNQPLLFIASDDPEIFRKFITYSPITAADIAPPLPGAEFYDDFHMLTQADYLAISNSTFSFVAAMLNERALCFVRPDSGAQQLVTFDPWNADVLLPGSRAIASHPG